MILITTPDNAIECVAKDLAQIGGEEWRGKVVLHTSGAIDSSVLKPLADLGAATGSMHPMQTFSDQRPPELAGRIFGIDGSPAALKVARKMIRQMGGVAVRLSGANKAAYHAAGSFACAHVLALMETATRLLMAQGFTRRQAVRALLPLTRQTLDNFESVGPRAAWTGPMARGDFSTVRAPRQGSCRFSAGVSGGVQGGFAAGCRCTFERAGRDAAAARPRIWCRPEAEKEISADRGISSQQNVRGS